MSLSNTRLEAAPTSTWRGFPLLLVVMAVLCWLICTIAQVEKYLGLTRAAVACAVGSVAVIATLLVLRRVCETGRDIRIWPLLATFLIMVLSFAVIYPKSQHHAPGKGSDREDALRVELYGITHHQYPYSMRTYLGHPPTPLPGALVLAAPFYFAGRIAVQNLLWIALFFLFLTRYFRKRATALAFIAIFLVSALENLNDIDVGGDYVANILYVSIAMFTFYRAIDREAMDWKTYLSVIFLGLALSSRIIYVVTLPTLLALALQSPKQRRSVLLLTGALFTSALVTLPVFMPHPFEHLREQLNQNADKLKLLPALISGNTLPVIALAVASLAFFQRMTLQLAFLLTGAASLIMILPPMLLFVSKEGGLRKPLTPDLEYLAVCAIFLSLWIFARWEQLAISTAES